jgi:hypothetical protein
MGRQGDLGDSEEGGRRMNWNGYPVSIYLIFRDNYAYSIKPQTCISSITFLIVS